jgi:hypothetical protein
MQQLSPIFCIYCRRNSAATLPVRTLQSDEKRARSIALCPPGDTVTTVCDSAASPAGESVLWYAHEPFRTCVNGRDQRVCRICEGTHTPGSHRCPGPIEASMGSFAGCAGGRSRIEDQRVEYVRAQTRLVASHQAGRAHHCLLDCGGRRLPCLLRSRQPRAESALASDLPPAAVQLIRSAKKCAVGTGIRLPVEKEEDIAVAMNLAAAKLKA